MQQARVQEHGGDQAPVLMVLRQDGGLRDGRRKERSQLEQLRVVRTPGQPTAPAEDNLHEEHRDVQHEQRRGDRPRPPEDEPDPDSRTR